VSDDVVEIPDTRFDDEGASKEGDVESERETIREAALLRQEMEREQRVVAERARRREERGRRASLRREERTARAREAQARRVRALKEANGKVADRVADASRALRGALRAASEVPLGRQSAEGREQRRLVRSIEDAMGALRRIRRGVFHEGEMEVDLDLHVD
jgi:hypothetical protein